MRRLIIIILALAGFVTGARSQAAPDELLQALANNMDKINRFEVEARITVDVEFIKIKERFVKVRYQKPDKFEFDAEGLALLPKSGMQLDYLSLINQPYTAIRAGEEDIRGIRTVIIKIIPEEDLEDVILAQLWIDPQKLSVMRMKTFTKKSGTYLIDFKFTNHPFNLPDQTIVTFDISNMSIPAKMMSEFRPNQEKLSETPTTAKVIVQYSNYRVN
jgi:outer membrane lipoprotein-sorting protein